MSGLNVEQSGNLCGGANMYDMLGLVIQSWFLFT
jgi:hypothetical protein